MNSSRAWKAADAESIAHEALKFMSIDSSDLKLIRLGENGVFVLPNAGIVLRVSRPGADSEAIATALEVAGLLALRGAPVLGPASIPNGHEPLYCGDSWVTFWDYYPGVDEPVDYSEFGKLLSKIHSIGYELYSEGMDCPLWRPLGHLKQTLEVAKSIGVPGNWRSLIESRAEGLSHELSRERKNSAEVLLHGDAHVGNVVVGALGTRISDLDSVSIGPAHADLVPTFVQRRRFGLPEDAWNSFLAGTEIDPAALHDSVLVELRELTMTSWLMQQFGTSEVTDAEIELRIECISYGDRTTQWTVK